MYAFQHTHTLQHKQVYDAVARYGARPGHCGRWMRKYAKRQIVNREVRINRYRYQGLRVHSAKLQTKTRADDHCKIETLFSEYR